LSAVRTFGPLGDNCNFWNWLNLDLMEILVNTKDEIVMKFSALRKKKFLLMAQLTIGSPNDVMLEVTILLKLPV
jgi:hypothetical protein